MTAHPREPASPLAAGARALAWVAAAVLIAAGGAGIVAGAGHPPGDEARPELTWRADAALAAALDGLDAPLAELSVDVDALSGVARNALVDTVARRDELVAEDLERGAQLAASIEKRSADLTARVAALPGAARPDTLGEAAQAGLLSAQDAAAAVEPLAASWEALAGSTLPPLRVASLIAEHDQSTFDATQAGVDGRFGDARDRLAASARALADIRTIAADLAPGADATTLTAWIDIAAAYDSALAALYRELATSGGEMTAAARAALAEVERAQARLPADTSALTVIMGELAQGGLNQAAIAIERARGALAEAVAALD